MTYEFKSGVYLQLQSFLIVVMEYAYCCCTRYLWSC